MTTIEPSMIANVTYKVQNVEERCTEQLYTMVVMLNMEGKKIFKNTDQNTKLKLDSGASV